ncbi:uncharacterized protein EI97DRAFT_435707 [Westerdykella ornata]|uniref:Uncharacterized protein n=1 Tax=Westerdykella ornata TaxID=318751 RepID=A0A6A6JBX3_WESOR|nr:uncharacterized protein EI97DRAFT_435707 [Westerdykella ornata]KAF2273785.1 hypothetical protein EI97DRAFT_435707 [Westerdykella ornata]
MIANAPDVRDSTANALKLSCPSAELVAADSMPSSSSQHTPTNPFVDAENVEWSDEEELLPKSRRRKPQYVPPRREIDTSRLGVADSRASWTQSSSGSESPSAQNGRGVSSPVIPPKSPSRLGSSHEDLVQRFYQVTRERDALRKELQRKSMGPHGIPARASVVYKSEEKALIEGLLALRHEIRVWSEEYFGGQLSKRSKRPHLHSARELFAGLTSNYSTYLKHHQDRPLLMQAYLWSKLQQRVFSTIHKGCGYVWAGKLGDKHLRPLNDTLRKAVKNEDQAAEYHQWRALTVNLLVPQVDGKWRPTFDATPVLKRISRFCSRLRRRLRPWATRSLSLGKEQLRTIVSAAVALDLKMKSQRADYRFVTFTGGREGQFYGYGFYDSEMEDVDVEEVDEGPGPKGRRVELSLAPALERCGNANGHIFEQSFILVKADVSCRRLGREREKVGRKRRVGRGPGERFRSWVGGMSERR